MKKLLLCLLTILLLMSSYAQDYKITFSGSGESNTVDSVLVQNLTQGTSVKMSGKDTLLLQRTFASSYLFLTNKDKLNVFPNPSFNESNVEFVLMSSENVVISLYEISGKQISSSLRNMESGLHQISIIGLNKGIYIIKVQSNSFFGTAKIASNGTKNGFPVMNYNYLGMLPEKNKILKSTQDAIFIPFPYLVNDNILITAESTFESTIPLRGVITLQMTEEPEIDESGIFEFEFVKCVDACGNSYATIEIGDQTWMAENLKCETTNGSWVYENNSDNLATYGRLYNWGTAMANAPEGWHLPSIDEWKQLYEYIKTTNNDESQPSIDAIKSSTYWLPTDDGISGNGTNTSGITLLPGGYYSNGNFNGMGLNGNYWTSTIREDDTNYSQVWRLFRWNTNIGMGYMTQDDMGLSVRYIKDNIPTITTQAASEIINNKASLNGYINNDGGYPVIECGIYWSKTNQQPDANDNIVTIDCTSGSFGIFVENLEPNTTYYYRAFAKNSIGTALGEVVNFTTNQEGNSISYGSFIDYRDGHVYKTVTIGEQTWMAENMAYLPSVNPPTGGSETVPYYYVYGYDGNNVNDAKENNNYSTYGVLYNIPAAKAACPNGWHLPSDDEWAILSMFLGGGGVAGGKLKETGTTHWLSPNTKADNTSGFTALPGGFRDKNGTVGYYELHGYWWSSTEYPATLGYWYMGLHYNHDSFDRYSIDKNYGLSVRYIKD